MTIKELSRLYYLRKLIERDTQRLRELKAKLQAGAQSITGMPHNAIAFDKIGNIVPSIVDIKIQIENEMNQYIIDRQRIEEYIENIEEPQIRLIFSLRFVDIMSWKEVADYIGGNNTEDSVKKACYRYLKTNRD